MLHIETTIIDFRSWPIIEYNIFFPPVQGRLSMQLKLNYWAQVNYSDVIF